MAGCTCENWTLQDLSSALQTLKNMNISCDDGTTTHLHVFFQDSIGKMTLMFSHPQIEGQDLLENVL